MQTSDRNGAMIGVVQVFDGDELMMISDQGTMVRTRTDEISILGRNTQGVRVIRLKEGEHVVGVERIEEPDEIVVVEEEGEEAVEVTDTAADTPTATDADQATDGESTEE